MSKRFAVGSAVLILIGLLLGTCGGPSPAQLPVVTATETMPRGPFPTLMASRASAWTGAYLGQPRPGRTPTPFAPEVFSAGGTYGYHLHSSLYFTPDGREVLFTHQDPDSAELTIHSLRHNEGGWGEPGVASFSGSSDDNCAAFSADGSRFYFTSHRPVSVGGKRQSEPNLWYVERAGTGWSQPVYLGSPMDLDRDEGTLYFGALLEGGLGGADIYSSSFTGHQYEAPENLGLPVNSEASEYAALIASDDSYLVIYRFDPRIGDKAGLYLSLHLPGGSWSEPVDLDVRLGLESGFDASLSPDGEYLFVLDRGVGVYWVEAATLTQ